MLSKGDSEMCGSKLPAWVFWPLAILSFAAYLVAWSFGELGTFRGTTGAPLVWILSVMGGFVLASAICKRILL
jgi:hypothetical protein